MITVRQYLVTFCVKKENLYLGYLDAVDTIFGVEIQAEEAAILIKEYKKKYAFWNKLTQILLRNGEAK